VNFGDLLVDGSFLLGRAVDDVAEYYEAAEGAFVWLMPSADRLDAAPYPPNAWDTMAFKYGVPLKGGRVIATTAISPFVDTLEVEERRRIRSGYEAAMESSRVDVTVKRQNTLRFLDHVDQVQGIARVKP
jgi:hypothetical protein